MVNLPSFVKQGKVRFTFKFKAPVAVVLIHTSVIPAGVFTLKTPALKIVVVSARPTKPPLVQSMVPLLVISSSRNLFPLKLVIYR